MKSTDLLNPGDFHQVTHQIRELVAYAISQLETAEQDGSLPSGNFAAFLIDAATKCPGYHGPGGENLLPHQALVENGDTIAIRGRNISCKVVNSRLESMDFVEQDVMVLLNGTAVPVKVGAETVEAKVTVANQQLTVAAVADTTVALVHGDQQFPMHDQGGAAGTIDAKVQGNKVVDMRFSTPAARIFRVGDQSLMRSFEDGAVPKAIRYAIDAQGEGSFSFVQGNTYAVLAGATITYGGVPGAGRFVSVEDGAVMVAQTGHCITPIGTNVQVCNTGQPPGVLTLLASTRQNTVGQPGLMTYCVIDRDGYALKNGQRFLLDGVAHIATILDGRVSAITPA